MIGSLLYVTASRPDVIQVVKLVARFQANPKEAHVLAIKRIFRYLKGTTEFGLWYPKENELILVAYIDANWAGSIDDRKSTSGAMLYLGDCLVSWSSKKQSSVSLSTKEAKYDKSVMILYDNTSAINISKNPVMHSKTKHIPIKFLLVNLSHAWFV